MGVDAHTLQTLGKCTFNHTLPPNVPFWHIRGGPCFWRYDLFGFIQRCRLTKQVDRRGEIIETTMDTLHRQCFHARFRCNRERFSMKGAWT